MAGSSEPPGVNHSCAWSNATTVKLSVALRERSPKMSAALWDERQGDDVATLRYRPPVRKRHEPSCSFAPHSHQLAH